MVAILFCESLFGVSGYGGEMGGLSECASCVQSWWSASGIDSPDLWTGKAVVGKPGGLEATVIQSLDPRPTGRLPLHSFCCDLTQWVEPAFPPAHQIPPDLAPEESHNLNHHGWARQAHWASCSIGATAPVIPLPKGAPPPISGLHLTAGILARVVSSESPAVDHLD